MISAQTRVHADVHVDTTHRAVAHDQDGPFSLAVAIDKTRGGNRQGFDDFLEEDIGAAEHAVAEDTVRVEQVDLDAHRAVVQVLGFGDAADFPFENTAGEGVKSDGRGIADVAIRNLVVWNWYDRPHLLGIGNPQQRFPGAFRGRADERPGMDSLATEGDKALVGRLDAGVLNENLGQLEVGFARS